MSLRGSFALRARNVIAQKVRRCQSNPRLRENSNGSIRIVGPNSQCDINEFPLDWTAGTPESSGAGGVFAFIGRTFDSFPACSVGHY
jgi:hypothetical protein